MSESEETQIVPVDDQELIQEAKRHQNKLAVQQTLSQEINATHADYLKLSEEVIPLGLKIENARIKLGTLLTTAKTKVGHGKFERWIGDNCKELSLRSAQRYMQFSKIRKGKLLENLNDLREYNQLLMRLGLKETAEGQGHGVQQIHDFNPFTAATKAIGKVNETFNLIWEKKPKDEWTDDELEQLKDQLAPIVKIYEELG